MSSFPNHFKNWFFTLSDLRLSQFLYEEEHCTLWPVKPNWLLPTHHLPGIADIVGFLSSLPQLVDMPRQGWVHRDCDNLAA
jgi:hypothetical protein